MRILGGNLESIGSSCLVNIEVSGIFKGVFKLVCRLVIAIEMLELSSLDISLIST